MDNDFCPTELANNMALIPYYAHLAWYRSQDGGVQWERESILWIKSLHLLLPKQLHAEQDIPKLKDQFHKMFATLQRKNKLLLNKFTQTTD